MAPLTERRTSQAAPALPNDARGRPVLLVTLDVPFDQRAAIFAVDAAVEAGQPLIVANVVELLPLPVSTIMGYDHLDYPPELEASLRNPTQLAASLGVRVERLRVKTPRPSEALLQLAREREAGILVFGPDRSKLPARRYRRIARAVSLGAACLVWLPDQLPLADEGDAPGV